MVLQDKYDELDNIVSTLNILIKETSIRDYVDQLNEISSQAKKDLEEIEPILQKEYDEECKGQLKEYFKSVI